MSRDIRSYFSTGSKSVKTNPKPAKESPAPKRKAFVVSSDEEEGKSQNNNVEQSDKKHKKRRVLDSDDDEDVFTEKPSKPNLSKLKQSPKKPESKKPVDISSFFGTEPAQKVYKKSAPEKKKPVETDVSILLSDDEFDKTIGEVDENALLGESSKPKASSTKQQPVNGNSKTSPEKPNTTPSKFKNSSQSKLESKIHKEDKNSLSALGLSTNADETKLQESSKTPKNKQNTSRDLDSSVLSDEERHERKRMTAILYQKYKNRTSVINPGSKEVPQGKPNCLTGLTFLVTGILESLEREEANTLIKSLGGKISTVVGKKLNFMVVGEEAGPKKLALAEELSTKIISEDGLFDLIREKSGEIVPKNEKNGKSPKQEEKSPKFKQEKSPKQRKEEKETTKRKAEFAEGSVKSKIKKENDIETEVSENVEFRKDSVTPVENLAWVDKYKPKTTKEIIGQQGPASNCVKLKNWLLNWYKNHDGKKKLQKPNPWAKNDDGSYYKAALLSGPPGVGKTTTANLVSRELGFDIVELNASDTRNKRLLKDEISDLTSNKSLFGYCHKNSGNNLTAVSKKHVLLMDEVDGMAGNEDRGGIQELISLIKETSIPIICMCNDRNHQKMRSLVNYCYDLRFNKPRLEQIKGSVMSICFKEKVKLPPAKIDEIIAATNNDIRQTLNHLSLLAAGKELNLKESSDKTAQKDLKLGPWEVVRKVFSVEENKNMSMYDRSDLFFHDYSLGPLFVQQNYLIVSPNVPKPKAIDQVYLAAESLSMGDLVEKRIRSNSAWSLLPVQAIFSSVMPGTYMSGHFVGQINFPGWLGKNSKTSKRNRLAQEIHDHTRIRTSGSKNSIRLDYAPFLLDAIVRPLKLKGVDGVGESLNVIKEYRLLREDIESLIELSTWPGKKNPMDSVDGKVKAALTRAYNKEVLAYSYSIQVGTKKKKSEEQDDQQLLEGTDEPLAIISDDEDDDKIENDALIKAKKKAAAKGSGAASTSKGDSKKASGSSTSKAKAGRGKK